MEASLFYGKRKQTFITVVPRNNIDSECDSSSEDEERIHDEPRKSVQLKSHLLVPVDEDDEGNEFNQSAGSEERWPRPKYLADRHLVIPPTPIKEVNRARKKRIVGGMVIKNRFISKPEVSKIPQPIKTKAVVTRLPTEPLTQISLNSPLKDISAKRQGTSKGKENQSVRGNLSVKEKIWQWPSAKQKGLCKRSTPILSLDKSNMSSPGFSPIPSVDGCKILGSLGADHCERDHTKSPQEVMQQLLQDSPPLHDSDNDWIHRDNNGNKLAADKCERDPTMTKAPQLVMQRSLQDSPLLFECSDTELTDLLNIAGIEPLSKSPGSSHGAGHIPQSNIRSVRRNLNLEDFTICSRAAKKSSMYQDKTGHTEQANHSEVMDGHSNSIKPVKLTGTKVQSLPFCPVVTSSKPKSDTASRARRNVLDTQDKDFGFKNYDRGQHLLAIEKVELRTSHLPCRSNIDEGADNATIPTPQIRSASLRNLPIESPGSKTYVQASKAQDNNNNETQLKISVPAVKSLNPSARTRSQNRGKHLPAIEKVELRTSHLPCRSNIDEGAGNATIPTPQIRSASLRNLPIESPGSKTYVHASKAHDNNNNDTRLKTSAPAVKPLKPPARTRSQRTPKQATDSVESFTSRAHSAHGSGENELYGISLSLDSDKSEIDSPDSENSGGNSTNLQICNKKTGKPSQAYNLPKQPVQAPTNSAINKSSSCSSPSFSDVPVAFRLNDWVEGDILEAEFERPSQPMIPNAVKTPVEYFRYFFDQELIKLIVDQSNLYSQQQDGESINISVEEIEAFLGIMIYMGVCKMPAMEDYWSARTRVPQVADVLGYRRFQSIRARIHFVDNAEDPGEDRFRKVRPLMNYLRSKCQSLDQDFDVSIDETMVGYKGKFAGNLRQYMPNKPSNKWGFKFFVLASVNGMVLDFIPYCGPGTFSCENLTEEERAMGLGAMAVISLCKGIRNPENTSVTFDNFYTGIPLVTYLKEKMHLHATGTIQKNRHGCNFTEDKKLKEKGRGSAESRINKNGVVVIKWYDNKPVYVASTLAGIEPSGTILRYDKTARSRIPIPCPKAILNYNKNMGGVDLCDMYLALYKCRSKSKRWYFPIFAYMVDLALTNSWLAYKQDCALKGIPRDVKTSKDFRVDVFLSLTVSSQRQRGRPSLDNSLSKKRMRKHFIPRPAAQMRLDGYHHWPIKCSKNRCRYCEKGFSRVKCSKCDACLCLNEKNNCFTQYHTQKELLKKKK